MTKKLYNQPEVQVAHIVLKSMILAGSANMTMDKGTTINPEQW